MLQSGMLSRMISHAHQVDQSCSFENARPSFVLFLCNDLHYIEIALSGTAEHDQTEGASDMGMTKFIKHLPVSFNQRIIV